MQGDRLSAYHPSQGACSVWTIWEQIIKNLCYYLCYCNTESYHVIFSVWIIQTLV